MPKCFPDPKTGTMVRLSPSALKRLGPKLEPFLQILRDIMDILLCKSALVEATEDHVIIFFEWVDKAAWKCTVRAAERHD